MKKIFFTLCMLGSMLSASAQLTVYHDTVTALIPKDGISKLVKDSIINNTGAVITVNWLKTNEVLLTGWSCLGICDKLTCYPAPANGNYSFTIDPGEKVVLYVDVKALPNAVDGVNYITLKVNDGVTDQYMTYKFYSWATQIKDIENNNAVSVYPNPASNFLYLNIIDPKVTDINVVNIIGKKIVHFDIDASTPNPIRVPIENFAKGIYLLQFTDNKGKIMGVKRVTKQ